MDVVIEPRLHSVNGKKVPHSMLIPSREMIVAKIEAVSRGGTSSLGAIRNAMAKEFGADACCPVTTQRHVRAIAEDVASGRAATPYWRVVDPDAAGTRLYKGGQEFVREQRQAEARSSAKKSPVRASPSAKRSS
jgi:hypothetical protein